MLTRRSFQLFTLVFLLLALSTAAVLANPKLLLPDGSPSITGEWSLYVKLTFMSKNMEEGKRLTMQVENGDKV